jgi:hypothetical protein
VRAGKAWAGKAEVESAASVSDSSSSAWLLGNIEHGILDRDKGLNSVSKDLSVVENSGSLYVVNCR